MPLTDEELKSIVITERDTATAFHNSELSSQREDAMKYYLAEPFGDERDGRSKVVMTDVADTIEWILPSLLRIFTASNKVVEFDPVDPDDIEAAEQETDYVNWVFTKDNPGFLILYAWFKDALLQKNGIVKHWWQVTDRVEQGTYKNLLDDQLAELVSPDTVEVLEHTLRVETLEDPVTGAAVPVQVHDVKISRKTRNGRVAVENVPPEEFLISERAKTIKDAGFVAHRVRKTRSELIEMGFDKTKIMDAPGMSPVTERQNEKDARHAHDETNPDDYETRPDKSMQVVDFLEAYIRVDKDGDGIAELLKVDMVADTLLEWEVADAIPFSSQTPIPMPHKFFGLSIADLVMDLQRIRSTIVRQGLDNMYLVNNPKMEVPSAAVGEDTFDDLGNESPGGFVRTEQGGQLNPIQIPPTWQNTVPMLETFDRVRESRTGVTRFSAGLDPDTLSQDRTAVEVNALTEGANQRVELIARIFAETGVKALFLAIHALVRKYQDTARIIRLRGKFVSVDPSDWRERMDLTANVGLGTGNRDQQASFAAAILDRQMAFRREGMTQLAPLQAIAESFRRMVEATGQKAVDKLVPDLSEGIVELTQEELQAQLEQAFQQGALQAQQDTTTQAQALAESQSLIEQTKTQGKVVEIQEKLRADLVKQQASHEDTLERDEAQTDQKGELITLEKTLDNQLAPPGQ